MRPLATQPDAMEIALWYHDAIYDTHAADNEEQSATLAAHILRDAAVPEVFLTAHDTPEFSPSRPYTLGAVDVWMLLQLIDYFGVSQFVSTGNVIQAAVSWFNE